MTLCSNKRIFNFFRAVLRPYHGDLENHLKLAENFLLPQFLVQQQDQENEFYLWEHLVLNNLMLNDNMLIKIM
jgi:hypothetical protein